MLNPDAVIIIVYLAVIVMVGVIMQRRASAGIDSYFLGNRKMPWWALGASGMASNMDVSGTMLNTAWIFSLGAIGLFIEIRGGVTLIMAFLMIFMGKWNRRAKVMTMAEWMHFRFGKDRAGNVARLMSAISILMTITAMITYMAKGSGKFVAQFLGIPEQIAVPQFLVNLLGISPVVHIDPQFWAAALMITLAMIYTVASGLYGVVWTDVVQGVLIFGTIVYICILAMTQFSIPDTFSVSIPMEDKTFQAIETSRQAWTNVVPPWKLSFPQGSEYSVYNLFGLAIFFYVIKVAFEGAGGTSGYMIQRYFASKSDRDAGLLSLFWTFLLAFRWPFIAAIAIMGVAYGSTHGVISDPETVLPVVITELVPAGIKGFLIAGLMAAAMSTFDSTVNAGASYWVKDIYQAFINPKASEKKLMRHSRWASVIIVIAGLLFSLTIRNINDIWGWITMSISAGLLIPTLVRWYWWRLNGWGFAIGTAAGMVAAVTQRILFPDVPEYIAFIFATGLSFIGMIIGTYATQPTDLKVLKSFYEITRPFGLWHPVRNNMKESIMARINSENRRDIVSIFFAVPWQVVLFLMFMMVVMKRWDWFGYLAAVLAVLSIGLYFKWFRYLSTEVKVKE